MGSLARFNKWVNDCSMLDMKFSGPRLTWSRGLVHERLDRFLCNEWYDTFPNTNVLHLANIKFDHRPILLIANEI